jgi:hypothetical protein
MPKVTANGGYVAGLVGTGPRDAWLGVPTGGPVGNLRGELLHWNGARWSHVNTPRGVFNEPTGAPIVQDGHGGLWMQGNTTTSPYPL